MKQPSVIALEERTARLTILIDPRKKAVFEQLCAKDDVTPSQMIRKMIRSYIEERLGRPWSPDEEAPTGGASGRSGSGKRRSSKS
jgi:hypothetical protein